MKNLINKFKPKLTPNYGYKFELAFILVSIVAILCCQSPALRSHAWPQGSDFEYNTEIQAEHFRQGDILPIWSSNDAYGMGSPLPLYYHKTFYYVSGAVLLVTNSVRLSIIATVSFFMLVGVYGLRFCLRKFTDNGVFLILVPQTLLFANYTFTDWLVRDDMAEFAALMLLPWLLWWCMKLLIDKKFSLAIVPIMFLLINAHNVVALFAFVPLISVYALFLLKEKMPGFRKTIKKLLWSSLILIVLLAPELILEKMFLRYYDPSKITQAGYLATSNFRPFGQYFYFVHYKWLNVLSTVSVQIDYGIWIPIAVILAGLIMAAFYRRKLKHIKKLDYAIVILLVLNILFFLFLQLSISRPAYEHIHAMQYLQFPWRLLVYITVLGIVLISYVATRFKNKLFLGCFAVVWLGCSVILSPAFKTLDRHYPIPKKFSYAIPRGAKAGSGSLIGIGEYLPRVYKNGQEISGLSTVDLYAKIYLSNKETEVLSGGPCKISEQLAKYYESLTLEFSIQCSNKAQIALPISYNNFTDIKNAANNQEIKYSRTDFADPRILITLPKTQNTILKIELPSDRTVIKKFL